MEYAIYILGLTLTKPVIIPLDTLSSLSTGIGGQITFKAYGDYWLLDGREYRIYRVGEWSNFWKALYNGNLHYPVATTAHELKELLPVRKA